MTMHADQTLTAFVQHRRLAAGDAAEVAAAVAQALQSEPGLPVLVFRDADGQQVDLDLRGSDGAIRERYTPATAPRGPGRPRLGVVPREVTLLPRHWDWLATQPGGASVALRWLVERAMKQPEARLRARRDAAYAVMHPLAGDLPGFEAASRALFAGDGATLETVLESWPADIAAYVRQLQRGPPSP
jgi:uncharacterized protein